MEQIGQRVRITNANFRQGYGKEGRIIRFMGNRARIRYEDDGEVYEWILAREDFQELDEE
ncbi:MAG: hypothetical protein ACOX6S_07135 [Clostridia bacterium]|jgi:RNase P/RNase MRP subunit p29